MLILSGAAFEEAGGAHPILGWPGPLCVWTAPDMPARVPPQAVQIDFDPAPAGLVDALRAALPRLAYFGRRPEGAVLCAARLPQPRTLEALAGAAASDPWAVEIPRSGLWPMGRRAEGVLMLGAGIARSPGLARALRALPAGREDAGGAKALDALAHALRAEAA